MSGQNYPYPTVVFIGLWPHTKSCTAFIWYLLRAVTPPSHYISAILTYRSYIIFLIHSDLVCIPILVLTYIHVDTSVKYGKFLNSESLDSV